MPKKTKKRLKKTPPPIDKQSDVPASQGQLEAVRSELKSEMTSMRLEMSSLRTEVRAEMSTLRTEVRSEISSVRSEISSVRSEMSLMRDELKAMITDVATSVLSVKAIVEEQNARNKFVIDGYKAVIDVQQNHTERIKRLEKSTFGESEV